jgi:uncharacterized protein YjiS (DUF1127 family)
MLQNYPRFNLITLQARFELTVARPVSAGRRTWVVALIRRAWRIVIAIRHRRELAQLAERDDCLLADIGLTRNDLRAARCELFWRDPTSVLAARRQPLSGSIGSDSAWRGAAVCRCGDPGIDRPVHSAIGGTAR